MPGGVRRADLGAHGRLAALRAAGWRFGWRGRRRGDRVVRRRGRPHRPRLSGAGRPGRGPVRVRRGVRRLRRRALGRGRGAVRPLPAAAQCLLSTEARDPPPRPARGAEGLDPRPGRARLPPLAVRRQRRRPAPVLRALRPGRRAEAGAALPLVLAAGRPCGRDPDPRRRVGRGTPQRRSDRRSGAGAGPALVVQHRRLRISDRLGDRRGAAGTWLRARRPRRLPRPLVVLVAAGVRPPAAPLCAKWRSASGPTGSARRPRIG